MNKKHFLLIIAFFFCEFLQAQSSFVTVKEHQFQLNNKPYYYIGTNYWYGGLLALVKDPVKGKERLRKELDFLHANGVNNLRVLAGVEGTGKINGVKRVSPSLQKQQGEFDVNLLKGLDYLLSEMGKRNMKAVIFLSNNWEWSGGFLQYLNWNGLLADSILRRKLTWDENRDIVKQFYTCDDCKEAYKVQVKLIVNRRNTITRKAYKDDAVIMSWELANEPRPMRPEAIPAFSNWVDDASTFIRTLDKNHLITTGCEGEMGNENLETFRAVHTFKNIDYLTIHIWPKNWGWFTDTSINKGFKNIISNTQNYITKHIDIAQGLRKPLVIEEFGLPRDNHLFNTNSPTTLRNNYFRAIFTLCNESRIRNGVIAGCNFWGFGGMGRAAKNSKYWWSDGDDYTVDPPPEEQGLNSVFDTDKSTWQLITGFTKMIK
ncbi:MAG: hypothetical protein ABIN01_12910 [Ferruginibacter sp.]